LSDKDWFFLERIVYYYRIFCFGVLLGLVVVEDITTFIVLAINAMLFKTAYFTKLILKAADTVCDVANCSQKYA